MRTIPPCLLSGCSSSACPCLPPEVRGVSKRGTWKERVLLTGAQSWSGETLTLVVGSYNADPLKNKQKAFQTNPVRRQNRAFQYELLDYQQVALSSPSTARSRSHEDARRDAAKDAITGILVVWRLTDSELSSSAPGLRAKRPETPIEVAKPRRSQAARGQVGGF